MTSLVEVTASRVKVFSCSLAGRCSNGFEADGGTVIHAVPERRSTALCGAKPGRRSAGWGEPLPKHVTCERCRRKLGRFAVDAPAIGVQIVATSLMDADQRAKVMPAQVAP